MPLRDSTHAYIGYIDKNNIIKYAYVHSHGCPKFLGKILLCSYNTNNRITRLLLTNSLESGEHGLKMIGLDPPYTTKTIDEYIYEFIKNGIEFAYLFDGNRWLVAGSTKIKDDLVWLTEDLIVNFKMM